MASIKWQDFLNVLTLKGTDTQVISKIKSVKENNKFSLCYSANKIYLEEWLAEKIKVESKSPSESAKYRLEGNKVYQKGKDEDALKIYNSSVTVAPHNTNEFALALANRSAVLLRLNHFKEALRDIDLALQHGDDGIPRQKLLIRKALLLHKLDLSKESLQIIRSLYPNEDEIEKLDNEDLKNVYHDLLLEKTSQKTSNQEECIPSPKGGENKSFSCASAYVSLEYSEEKGRHVIAKKDLDIADIIFVEKPFALVVLPDQYDHHCHHCCKETVAFIPCERCSQAQFCSDTCRVAAWDGYHRWECGGLSVCHSIGIAHLGLRVALLADDSDTYKRVCDLVTHIDDMKDEDVYQYAITAVLLTLYLEKYSSFFQDHPETSVDAMGCRVLRHIAQLICNGHAITKIDSNLIEKGFANTKAEAKVRIATAIYPSVSMMNHSCDQNISNSFINEVLVVRAMKPIKKGEEVFNCYGPHHSSSSTEERQKALRDQYFFTCHCHKCSKSSESEFCQFSALRCSFCSGPVMEGEGQCSDCGRPQMLVELVNMALTAQEGFHQGQRCLSKGNFDDAINLLEKAVSLASKCLYKHNSDLRTYKDTLARVYAEKGRIKEAIQLVEECNASVEKQFGPSSMELSRELLKYRDLVCLELARLMEAGLNNSPQYRCLLKKMESTLKRVKRIIEANVDAASLKKYPGLAEAMNCVDSLED